MKTDNRLRLELSALAITAICSLTFFIWRKDEAFLLDQFFFLLIGVGATVVLGMLLSDFGQKKLLAFGEHAGHYITIFVLLAPCAALISYALGVFVFQKQDELIGSSVVISIAAIASSLAAALIGISERLVRNQRCLQEENAKLRRQLGLIRNELKQARRNVEAFNKAAKRMQEEIADRTVDGNEVVRLFWNEKKRARAKLTDRYRKSKPAASTQGSSQRPVEK